MKNRSDYIEDRRFCIELLNSIREVDCRINELKMLINTNGLQQEKRKNILKRIFHLIDTRSKCTYSFMDVVGRRKVSKHPDISNPFDALEVQYRDLSRQISKYHPEVVDE